MLIIIYFGQDVLSDMVSHYVTQDIGRDRLGNMQYDIICNTTSWHIILSEIVSVTYNTWPIKEYLLMT